MLEPHEISRAAQVLREGGLVAFPTETVYGLGADAANAEAVKRIFAAKGRPADHPVIVHLASVEQIGAWAREIPTQLEPLAEAFWPGPLTLILKRSARVPDVVTGGQETVGIRVPSHPVAQALLGTFGGGVAAPSANRFGRISPTMAAHVEAELAGRVEMILDGGTCEVGLESTIVDLSGARPRVLRPGGISVAQLGRVLGETPAVAGGEAPRAPGTLERHYAPRTRTRLVEPEALLTEVRDAPGSLAVLARRDKPDQVADVVWCTLPDDPAGFARGLYASLRQLDRCGAEQLLIEAVPSTPGWLAVADRLRRAAARDG